MRGLQLQEARQLRRAELRRVASRDGFVGHDFLALDEYELLMRADLGDQSSHGNAVKRRLILDSLVQMRGGLAAVAAAWRVDGATLGAWMKIPRIDTSGIAAAIDAQVLEELPEGEGPSTPGASKAEEYSRPQPAHGAAPVFMPPRA